MLAARRSDALDKQTKCIMKIHRSRPALLVYGTVNAENRTGGDVVSDGPA
jgi:hypothetical protein